VTGRPVWWRIVRAAARDTRNAIALVILGPTCRVTNERVYPRDRVDHEHYEHPTDGPCVLL
jgi:hypothetical protein